MMTSVLLVLVGLLVAVAVALQLAALHRGDTLKALAAMTAMMIAAIVAAAYATLTS